MAIDVQHNPDESRYELSIDGEVVAFADYRVDGDRVVFPHTVVQPAHRGHGLGAELVRRALDDVRTTGRTVVPRCWYVAQFIDEHPAYRDLVAA